MRRFLHQIVASVAVVLGLTWLYGKKLPKPLISGVSCGVVFLAFLVSLFEIHSLRAMPPEARHITQELWTWFRLDRPGMFEIPFALEVDPLSAVMIFVVTGIGFLIHLYSNGYMHGDPRFGRFFAYMNLFVFFMSMLVLNENLLVLYLG